MRVALLSLEPWDNIWRRNQHFASRLVASGAVRELRFIAPPSPGFARRSLRDTPLPRIEVITPPLFVPRRFGGFGPLRVWLRRECRDADVLWINDPVAGAAAYHPGQAALYDVTDDWRSAGLNDADHRRVVRAEDFLAPRATTVVCSDVLATRWKQRYDVDAQVVKNGVDVEAIRSAAPRALAGPGPHAVYVGTVHPNRVDFELVGELAAAWPGTVHLVGPATFGPIEREQIGTARTEGAVPATEVPSWLAAADVLICPHVVNDFTLSLDAIKSYEYLATPKPVIATPSGGFQCLSEPGLLKAERSEFVAAAISAIGQSAWQRNASVDWSERAREFAVNLSACRAQ